MSQNDVFIEHMVTRQHTWKSRLIQMVGFLVAPVLSYFSMYISPMLPPIVFAGSLYLAWLIFTRQNVEYEYIVTKSEMDVDTILAKRSRKRLLTVDCNGFEILAPATARYANEINSQSIARRVDVCSSEHAENRWFAIFNDKEGKRTILFFEPDRRMLDAFQHFIPRKIQRP